MILEYRYIQIDETGLVTSYCSMPVEGVTIDTEGMNVPEKPTDAYYNLYYTETEGLHWVKVADFEPETPEEPTAEELMDILLGVSEA